MENSPEQCLERTSLPLNNDSIVMNGSIGSYRKNESIKGFEIKSMMKIRSPCELASKEEKIDSIELLKPEDNRSPSLGSASSYGEYKECGHSDTDGDKSPLMVIRSIKKENNSPLNTNHSSSTGLETRSRNGVQHKNYSKRGLSSEDRELFLRIEQEWREEDAWVQQPPGIVSTILWTPILIAIRCVNIWLCILTWPVIMFARVVIGWNIKTVSFWDVDLEKRKQTIAVAGFVFLLPGILMAYMWSILLLLFPLTTIPMALYYFYIFYIDKSAVNGMRRPFMRYWKLWRHFSNYFPLRLIRTEALDPSRKYVFAYHPHGIISIGAFGNFATNATGFSRKFPGIDLRLLTLEMNFWCPWVREFLLSMGVCSASKGSCNKILSKGPGSAIMLVVGGAAESLDTEPGTYRLKLDRKGFVRVALLNGADLVPVLGFGENDVFETRHYPDGTWGRSLLETVRHYLGFATPVFKFFPHRKPIIVVVGKPIKLPYLPSHLNGSSLYTTPEGIEIVDKYHRIYIDALQDIWDMYKNRWAVHRAGSLLLTVEKKPLSRF